MAVSVNIGGVLVDVDELSQRRHLIEDVVRTMAPGGAPRLRRGGTGAETALEFTSGSSDFGATSDAEHFGTGAGSSTMPEAPPVEFGRPLHLEVITAYTGRALRRRKTDLVVTSAVKYAASHEAMPKAVNQLFQGVSGGQSLRPGAFNQGSPTVFYSPALDESTLLFGLDMVLDSVDDKVFETLTDLFGYAAGIPVFAPARSLLMAGTHVVRTATNLARALFETGPLLRSRYEIRFNDPWYRLPRAGLMVLWPEGLSDHEIARLNGGFQIVVGDGGQRVHLASNDARRAPYEGEVPYLIVNMSTRERPELAGFRPQHAAAALLEQFYGADSPTDAAVKVLKEALVVYSDLEYQRRAATALGRLERLKDDPAGDAAAVAAEEKLIAAYLKNIHNDDVREVVRARAATPKP
jgi:hypothetical protein